MSSRTLRGGRTREGGGFEVAVGAYPKQQGHVEELVDEHLDGAAQQGIATLGRAVGD